MKSSEAVMMLQETPDYIKAFLTEHEVDYQELMDDLEDVAKNYWVLVRVVKMKPDTATLATHLTAWNIGYLMGFNSK